MTGHGREADWGHTIQAYGAAGVVKTIRILQREIVMGMQLIGARTVKDLVPEMVGVVFGWYLWTVC